MDKRKKSTKHKATHHVKHRSKREHHGFGDFIGGLARGIGGMFGFKHGGSVSLQNCIKKVR